MTAKARGKKARFWSGSTSSSRRASGGAPERSLEQERDHDSDEGGRTEARDLESVAREQFVRPRVDERELRQRGNPEQDDREGEQRHQHRPDRPCRLRSRGTEHSARERVRRERRTVRGRPSWWRRRPFDLREREG